MKFKTRYILNGRTHEFVCDHGILNMVFYHEVYGQNTFKKSKDKAVPGKTSFEYLWKSSCLRCFVTVFLAKLSYDLRSVNALN